MWKCYENVSVKWVCQIKNRGVVMVSILGHYSIPEISDVVSKYRVHRIVHHYYFSGIMLRWESGLYMYYSSKLCWHIRCRPIPD